MPNIYDANFEDREAPPGFRSRRARIGHEIGAESIGASIWELPPGEAAYPYHYHYAEEEIVIVLSGRPSLRSPDGVRELDEGEAVRFGLGAEGAHQILNSTDKPVRFLALSTNGRPDIIVRPDTGTVGVAERLPDGSGLRLYFKQDDQIGYWDAESAESERS
jgi:uncharacterized cupin superfamily protein